MFETRGNRTHVLDQGYIAILLHCDRLQVVQKNAEEVNAYFTSGAW